MQWPFAPRPLLSRLRGASRHAAGSKPKESVPFRRKPLLEALEPRLLLSADLTPVNESLISNGLQQLQAWSQTVGSVGELAHSLPVVNTTIGQAVDLAAILQSRIVTPVQAYLAQGGVQTTDGIVAALQGVLGAGTVTGDQYGDEIRFDVVLDESKVIEDIQFALAATQNGLALTADASGLVDLLVDLDLTFSFGIDLSDGLAPEERFFIRVDEFTAGASVDATLDFGLAVGFLQAQVTGGTLSIDALLDIGVLNPDGDAKGNITLSELLGTTIEGLIDPTVVTGTLEGELPVAVQALGSFNAGDAAVTLEAEDLFAAAPVVAVTGTMASEIANFGRAQPEAILQVLNQVAAWLNGLRSSDAFTDSIPLADSRAFGDVLRFAEGFTSGLIDQLTNAEGVATFATAQAFATRLSELLGLPPDAINASYNTNTNHLTFFLRLQSGFAAVSDTIDLNLNLAPLGGINTSSVLSIDASGTVQFVLGFDLSPFSAAVIGEDLLPANGVLTQDATFQVSLDGNAYVDVLVARDATNNSRAALIADINTALQAAGLTGLTASLDANRLRLTYAGGYTGAFLNVMVPNVATNTAATELRLKAVNTAVDSLTKQAFLRDVRATGNVTATAADIDATANFGFFGVGINNGTATATAQVDVQFRKGNNNATPMYFSDLFEGIDNIPQWTSITRTGTLDIDLPIAVNGGVLALPGAPRIEATMTNVFQANTLAVTFPDLQPLLNYRELDFGDVLTAFTQLTTYLNTIDGFSFLNADLPLVGMSVSDLVSFVERFGDARTALEAGGAATIQQLEQAIEQAFGIPPSGLTVAFAGQAIEFDLDLTAAFDENLGLNLNLGQLAGYTNTDGSNLNGVANLIDVGGNAAFDVTATATLNLIFGFDLSNPASPRAYIKDESSIALGARVAGSDLDFSAAVGPLGIFVRNGSVYLDNGAGTPALFSVAFKPVAGDRYYSNQWNTGALDVTVVGRAGATLPVYFPTENNPVGGAGNNNIQLTIGNLANIAGTTTLTAPNLAAEIGSIDLFNNMNSFVDGIDLILATIQDALDGQVFGIKLPFVGDSLKDGAQFIEELRTQIIQRLNDALSGGTQSANQVKQILFDALGPAGLQILLDRNNSSTVTADDVGLTTVDSNNDGLVDDVLFNLRLGREVTVGVPVGFDLGLPGLGFAVSDDSAVQLGLGFSFDLGIGVSRTHGVYIDTSALNEVGVTMEARLADFAMGGTLGILRVKVQDETNDDDGQDPSLFSGGFTIDLRDPVGTGNRLTFNELSSGNLNFAQVIDADLSATADINLDLVLGVPGDWNITDPNHEDFLSEQFPSLTADFNLTWTFSPATGLSGTLQNVSFDNVRLNFGEFLDNFLGPIVDNIADVFDPLKPILDAITEPLPVIS
ncbi:MAG: LEPR-XLL domain-containing protein, partial [Burkholderiales bacterium]|nr:LEPR-XLL domain-containing protein [Burkholderiales bacterium]